MTWLVISGVIAAGYTWYAVKDQGLGEEKKLIPVVLIVSFLMLFVGGLAINWLILEPLGIYLNNSQIPGYYERY
jgi:ABC-type uncharacterized transport system permease subunit